MTTPKKPRIALPETDFVKIGERFYTLTKIHNAKLDIVKELHEYYQKQLDAHVVAVQEAAVKTSMEEWDTQLEHLKGKQTRNMVEIPAALYEHPVMWHNKTLLELRAVRYAPVSIIGSRAWFVEYGVTGFPTEGLPHDQWELTLKHDYRQIIWYGFHAQSDTLYTLNATTYHTMNGGNVCTGNHKASDFWKADNFGELVNRINGFSLASQTWRSQDGKIHVHIRDLLHDATIINRTLITREGARGSAWITT